MAHSERGGEKRGEPPPAPRPDTSLFVVVEELFTEGPPVCVCPRTPGKMCSEPAEWAEHVLLRPHGRSRGEVSVTAMKSPGFVWERASQRRF